MAEQQHSWRTPVGTITPTASVCGWRVAGSKASGDRQTDELGINGVEERVSYSRSACNDVHCLGMDHKKLTYRHMGRDFRLTDVSGRVSKR